MSLRKEGRGASPADIGGGGVGMFGILGGYSPMQSVGSMYAMIAPYLVTQNVIDFSKQMGTIRAETLGTKIDQDALRDSILSVAGSSRFTAGDVSTAVVGAVRSGFQIDTELRGIQNLATLAVAENVDLQTAYSSVEPILNTLNVDLKVITPRRRQIISRNLGRCHQLGRVRLDSRWGLSSHLETGGGFDEFFAIASILRSSGKG